MIPVSEYQLPPLDVKIDVVSQYDFKKKCIIEYYNIPIAFDIETTSIYNNGVKFAFMYEWTFGVKSPNYICYGRTWNEFLTLCDTLVSTYELTEQRRIIIYVHNLGYEFQFMRKYFTWSFIFASSERKPIKALTDTGIEFRDSYILAGYSLAKVAENLTSHTIKKLLGDLDYSLVRLPITPLAENELNYCNNDVEILLDYIEEQIAQYDNKITKIPLTNTGRVRNYVRNNCLHSNKSHKKDNGSCRRYRELMQECSITLTQYEMLKKCFMGGFTHASMKYVNQICENVSSIDFTSSYPYVMLSEKFPMSKPILVDIRKEDFNKLLNSDEWGLMFECKLNGVHSKYTYDTYLSESKCYNIQKGIINNGRIFKADSLITTITDIDLKIIKECYDIESIQIHICYKFYMTYLPKQIIESILTLYEKKTTLKGVEGKEVEYLVNKGMLNSIYGMCVTDILQNEILYQCDEWYSQQFTREELEEKIEENNQDKKRFLYYPWGVWVTAYARKNLWNGILNIGNDYIYSDTDSIKLFNYESHLDYIRWYNAQCEMKLKRMCDFMKIDFIRCKPKTIKGVEKLLGVWDYEGTYTRFKTLGAKRYMYEDKGKIHITIAGLSKQNGVEYMEMKCKDNTGIFNMFNDELYIPSDYTGKNTHTYIDKEDEAIVTDYLGNTDNIKSLSSVHLEKCDFTLSIAKEYNNFLLMLKQGYLYKGIQFM